MLKAFPTWGLLLVVSMLMSVWPAATAQEAIVGSPGEPKLTVRSTVDVPTLTEVERLQFLRQFETLSLRMENDQLKMQIIKDDFEKVRAELMALVLAHQKADFAFDPATATYRADPLKASP